MLTRLLAVAALVCAVACPAMAQTATTPTFVTPGILSDYDVRNDPITGGVVLVGKLPPRAIYGWPGNGPGKGGVYVRFAGDRWWWDGAKFVPQFSLPGAAPGASAADIKAAEDRGYARGVQASIDALGRLR